MSQRSPALTPFAALKRHDRPGKSSSPVAGWMTTPGFSPRPTTCGCGLRTIWTCCLSCTDDLPATVVGSVAERVFVAAEPEPLLHLLRGGPVAGGPHIPCRGP